MSQPVSIQHSQAASRVADAAEKLLEASALISPNDSDRNTFMLIESLAGAVECLIDVLVPPS